VTPETLRLRAVGGLGLVLATLGVLVVRLAWLQLADAPAMTRAARGQHYSREEVVQAERGRILTGTARSWLRPRRSRPSPWTRRW
jgi:cell division protein FtsI/penicillin-binding protein 2